MSMPAFATLERPAAICLGTVSPRGGQSVAANARLTRKEAELLSMLVQNAGHCVSRETLLRTIWQYSEGTRTRTVDVHVQRLRRKLGKEADALKTIVRQGYCWFQEGDTSRASA